MISVTQAEIDEATETLAWCDLPTILRLREQVAVLIRRAVRGKQDRVLGSAETMEPIAWERKDLAVLFVMFTMPDSVLERALRRERTVHQV